MNLSDVLVEAAGRMTPPPEVTTLPDGSMEFSRDGVVFASVEMSGDSAAFRLDDELAAAARRTPDTGTTPRGNPWVVFGPGNLDAHAIDRANAWFEAAYRRAVTGLAQ
jgi:hypothetical protein